MQPRQKEQRTYTYKLVCCIRY